MSKNKIYFRTCQHTDHTPIPIPLEVSMSGKEYVYFGEDNDMPQNYWECYTDCSALSAVINSTVHYISGSGIDIEDKEINRAGEMLSELTEKIALDYIIYGQFALQVVRNKNHEIVELCYVDPRFIRLDESGRYVYYSKSWGRYNKGVKKYDRFNSKEEFPSSIFVYKNPISRGIYGTPIWGGAMRSVLTMIEADKTNYTNALNNFRPNTMISFNNGIPDADTMDELEEMVKDKYCGENGDSIMLTWSESKDNAPEISTFETPDYSDRYNTTISTATKVILSAFRCSPQLVGLNPDNTSFNSIEYENAYALWKETFIKPLQSQIEKAFSKIGFNFHFNEFKVTFSNNGNNAEVL